MNKTGLFLSILVAIMAICSVYAYACRPSARQATEATPVATPSAAAPTKGKVLVVYFSSPETDGVDASSGASRLVADGKLYGNTEYVATLISRKTGGDLFQIKTATPYPGTHKALIDAAKKEQEAKARPKLTTHIKNLDDYTTIFIGFPNWWYDMPMPLYAFFDEYDFTGKTLIPFCTHGGSRFSQTEKTIAMLEKGATMVKGLSISRNSVDRSEETINKWLQRLGFNN